MTKELLTPAEFQAVYNISYTTFYREVNAGRIAIIKIGRATRIARESAEKWLRQKMEESLGEQYKTDGTNSPSARIAQVAKRR